MSWIESYIRSDSSAPDVYVWPTREKGTHVTCDDVMEHGPCLRAVSG